MPHTVVGAEIFILRKREHTTGGLDPVPRYKDGSIMEWGSLLEDHHKRFGGNEAVKELSLQHEVVEAVEPLKYDQPSDLHPGQ